jgi:hypothetical protein
MAAPEGTTPMRPVPAAVEAITRLPVAGTFRLEVPLARVSVPLMRAVPETVAVPVVLVTVRLLKLVIQKAHINWTN